LFVRKGGASQKRLGNTGLNNDSTKEIQQNAGCCLTISILRIAITLVQGLQRYNLPADSARKLFKPPTDSASLLVEIEKKQCFILGLWFSGGGRHKWVCHFHFIGLV